MRAWAEGGWSLAWASEPAQPSHMGRVGPSLKNKKNQKNSFQKSVIFHKYFTAFGSILVCIFIL
jgi:hypothetical protein